MPIMLSMHSAMPVQPSTSSNNSSLASSLPKIEDGGSAWTAPLISFAAVVVEFLLTALVLFIIVKAANKAKNLKKKEEAPAEPTTKVCPFCQSEISIKATRCPHCTSELKD